MGRRRLVPAWPRKDNPRKEPRRHNAGICWYLLVRAGSCWFLLVLAGSCWISSRSVRLPALPEPPAIDPQNERTTERGASRVERWARTEPLEQSDSTAPVRERPPVPHVPPASSDAQATFAHAAPRGRTPARVARCAAPPVRRVTPPLLPSFRTAGRLPGRGHEGNFSEDPTRISPAPGGLANPVVLQTQTVPLGDRGR